MLGRLIYAKPSHPEAKLRILGNGVELPPETEGSKFDSNCITPGTEFMEHLSECLRFYIADKLSNDPGWKNVSVILSDAGVPGEGEHKIMDFIRHQRAQPCYDPNLRHVLYGLDADLIMLALATHEPHFKILREDVFWMEGMGCYVCGQGGHQARDCKSKETGETFDRSQDLKRPYVFLHVEILREYLSHELQFREPLPFPYDFERVIDDWVFLCFFVGNDFLPHLPSLDIREGAVTTLIELYLELLPRLGGYLTDSGDVSIERVIVILERLGRIEDKVFSDRKQREDRNENFKRRREAEQSAANDRHESSKRARVEEQSSSVPAVVSASAINVPVALPTTATVPEPLAVSSSRSPGADNRSIVEQMRAAREANIAAARAMKAALSQSVTLETSSDSTSVSTTISATVSVAAAAKSENESIPGQEDEVRLWESGFKDRYYVSKFGVTAEDLEFRDRIARAYLEGLCWVLKYYYQGCQSWGWYYPFHYSPFASDFVRLKDTGLQVTFDAGRPFMPLAQLMAVLPAASSDFVPDLCRELMTSEDSPIKSFYPERFVVDLNGKRHLWQGVALLPFIDQALLQRTLEDVFPKLTPEEQERNRPSEDQLFISHLHPLYETFCGMYASDQEDEATAQDASSMVLSSGVFGTVRKTRFVCLPGRRYPAPLSDVEYPALENNLSIRYGSVCSGCLDFFLICLFSFSVAFELPQFPEGFQFSAKLLLAVKLPPRKLTAFDLQQMTDRRKNQNGPHNRNDRSNGGRYDSPRNHGRDDRGGRYESPGGSDRGGRYESPGGYGRRDSPGNYGRDDRSNNQNRYDNRGNYGRYDNRDHGRYDRPRSDYPPSGRLDEPYTPAPYDPRRSGQFDQYGRGGDNRVQRSDGERYSPYQRPPQRPPNPYNRDDRSNHYSR